MILRRLVGPTWIRAGGILFSALSLLALLLILRGSSLNDFAGALGRSNPRWLAVAVALALTVEVLKTLRWQLLLGAGPGAFPGLLSALLTSRLMNALTPFRAGDLWRVAAGTRGGERPIVAAGGSVVAEKVLDGALLAMLAALLLGASSYHQKTLVLAGAAVVFLAAGLVAQRWLPGRLRRQLSAALQPLRHLREARLLASVVALSVGGMVLGTLANLAVLAALQLPVGFVTGAIMLLGGYAAGLVPAGPGRLAVFELAVAGPLTTAGVSPAESLLAAIGLHIVLLASLALGGLLALAVGLSVRFAGQPVRAPDTVVAD